jgi:Rrf2 family iron-sulfur cluster assembly transcriptional regulator
MLSASACYAVKALAYLASGRPASISVRDVAEATGIPSAYLAKIVNQLARKGLVVTQRGVGGGVAAAPGRPLAALTLHDLCVALDDPIVEQRCLIGQVECSDERACPAHAFWSPQRERLLHFLRRTTVRDVARFETGKPAKGRSRR